MTQDRRLTFGRLLGAIAIFVIVGTPMVAYLWETLNKALAGYFDSIRILIAVPVLALFVIMTRYIARLVTRWETQPLE